MLHYPDLSPVALALGPIQIRWYGILYLLAFATAYWALRRMLRSPRLASSGLHAAMLGDLFFFLVLGVIIGGRLGHVLLYNAEYFARHPQLIFALWQGGMSFHGGLIGVVIAAALFSRSRSVRLLPMLDALALLAPIGIALGRLGNFINGEIYGRVTDVPWCMAFPAASGCRHPLQLYQLAMEGLLLFGIVWAVQRWSDHRRTGLVSGTFLVGYGAFRAIAELFREAGEAGLFGLTTGHWLSIPMVTLGIVLIVRSGTRDAPQSGMK